MGTTAGQDISTVPPFSPRDAWLEERRKGIGSSDAASLYNEGYGCYKRLILDKRGVEPDFQRTPEELAIMDAGTKLEETVAREFIEECNAKLVDAGLKPFGIRRVPARICKWNEDLRANIDRQIIGVTAESLYFLFPSLREQLGDDPGPGIMEVKTTVKFVIQRVKHEGATLDWILQVQEQFAVVPHKWALIVAKARDTWETLPIPILPDADLIADISRRASDAMEVVRDEAIPLPPPLPDAKDKRCANCVYRKSCRGEMNAKANAALVREIGSVEYETDDTLAELANDFKMAQFQADDMQSLADAIKDKIKERMGDREAIAVPSAQVKFLFKTQKGRETLDTKALKAEMPEIAAKYMKVGTPVRSFRPVFE